MPNQDMWLIFKTKKEGNAPKELSNDLKELKSGLAGAVEGLTGFSLSGLGVAAAIAGIGAGMKKAVDGTVEYDKQIRDMQRLTGATAEESSRLIQVTDDLGVEYGDLAGALKIAAKNGIEPTIGSLAKLSDQYLALAPGQERSAFLMEKFGKNGLSMAAALEKGGAALLEMNAAIDGNLVRTQEQVDQSRAYEMALDAISDRIAGYATAIGSKLIPVFIAAFDAADKFFGYLEDNVMGGKFDKQEAAVRATSASYEDYIAQLTAAEAQGKQYIDENGDLVVQLDLYGQKVTKVVRENAAMTRSEYEVGMGMRSASGAAQDAADGMNDFSSSTEGAASDAAELGRIMDQMTKAAANRLNLEMGDLNTKMLFNVLAAGQDAAAQRGLAESMGLINPATSAALAITDRMTASMNTAYASASAYNQAAGALSATIAAMQDKNITITTRMITLYQAYNADEEGRGVETHYASGGSYQVPPGYYENYPVGIGKYASSGETVTITPAGGGKGGNLPAMNVYINNGMDLESFKRMLIDATRR